MAADTAPPSMAQQIMDPNYTPHYEFAFSDFLKKEFQFPLDPNRPVCKAYSMGHCPAGTSCPDKHVSSSSYRGDLVCKHWLRGLCKKGDACEYLHEYNLRRMPECNFYSRYQTCSSGEDCLYLHIDPEAKRPICPHYERGFCPLGPRCANKHVKKAKLCPFYLAGFCPEGKACKNGTHSRYPTDLKDPEVKVEKTPEQLEQERLEREQEREREEERERERDDRNPGFGGQQRYRGGWQGRKKRSGGRHRRGGY